MRPPASRLNTLLAAGLLGLAGCGSGPKAPPEEPTLATLAGRQPAVRPEQALKTTAAEAIAAYDDFLRRLPEGSDAPERGEAMRRLADLEMDVADEASASTGAAPDFKAAIARYQAYLKATPEAPGRDRVLYQLARAQEQGGDPAAALATLDQLVASKPAPELLAEAEFRRGEMLFTAGRHADAERAYGVVLAQQPETVYHPRALYMSGWSRFKQGQPEEALQAFFGVLDRKLGHLEHQVAPALTRADRELLEDTFRVTSLSLQSLDGARSIPGFMGPPLRAAYEPRVYEELAALYLKQERIKDAADTLAAFADRHPLHAQAPVMLSRVIGIHEQAGFASLALQAKKDFVTRYGASSEFRQANPAGWQEAQPLVKTHLAELARHHHALAQKDHKAEDVREAAHWYRAWLQAFPNEPEAAQSRFLLAELLFEDQRWDQAAAEYEHAAYDYPAHAKSAEAGYAVLLAQAKLEAAAPQDTALQQQGVARSLRFAEAFPADPRAGAVLTFTAERLFKLGDTRAPAVAKQVLALQPPASDEQRRVAWTVVGHAAFDTQAFAEAETAYREVLALTPAGAPARAALDERLAASVYKQGEAARSAGDLKGAVGHFERIASLAPDSPVRATAQYDAAAAMIAMKDWAAAAATLEDFRRRYPQHPLAAELPPKLAAAYLAQSQWGPAARELETVAAGLNDPAAARDAQWQAAELYDKAGQSRDAARSWERYVAQYPSPLVPAVKARDRLATLARERGDAKAVLTWTRALQQAERDGGAERTEQTRTLGAQATLALAEPVFAQYRQVRLVAPLQRNLKLKKTRLEQALQACAEVADYAVADAVTAAAFHSAALYQDFGQAMLKSERPRQLKKAELEQYNVMLEEQAFPFEEKAIALHAANARRAADGLWNDWIARSYAELATLQPGRYARPERGASGQTLAALEANPPADAGSWTALGLARRQQGQLKAAGEAYTQALALQPAYADALLNQAILLDLYLGDGGGALAYYQRYLAARPGGDATVQKWAALIERDLARAAPAQKPTPTPANASSTPPATAAKPAAGAATTPAAPNAGAPARVAASGSKATP